MTRVPNCFDDARLRFTAVDDVRRRAQNETTAPRGRGDDPLLRIRRLLRPRTDRLSPPARARVPTGLN